MNFLDQAHVARLATFAQHGQPKDYAASDMMRADLEALMRQSAVPEVGGALVVYVYRQPDGVTQVRAPASDDPELVIDMLTEALRAMSEGDPVVTQ